MGFDVTAAYAIFFLAALTAGSAAMGVYWTSADHIEGATREQQRLAEERAHTNMSIASANYVGGQQRFTVTVENQGSTVIDIPKLVYLIDGAYVASSLVTSATVSGAAATDLWQPTETLVIVIEPLAPGPTNFKMVAPNGAAAYWGT